MERRAKCGIINIHSFLNEEDRNAARDHMMRTASVQLREAAKIGLQSLYADPEEVLKKYKDFDIVKAMQARKGAKLLWVRARAIDADTVNANGDYFSRAELLKEVEVKGEKIPAYKTFEGVPIYTNHKNDDIEQAKGMVVYAEWDEEQNCVFCTFFVDEEAYPDIARNIRTGVIHDVSMGCQVQSGECSKCGNIATIEKEYCDCLKKYKGKKHPVTGEKIYEKNFGLKYIELSCVGDGAFETCEIEELYDVDEILDAAMSTERRANSIYSSIVLASTLMPDNTVDKHYFEESLREISAAAQSAVRLAQSAGTLVGGQLMAGEGADQNATVSAVLNALGIDPRSGLNILDLLNLALNFLEVAVMNLFARKDNVDLTHVGKITKSMADLQNTMQDMIDDGVDTGVRNQQPINQGQIANQPPMAAPQMPQGGQQINPGAGQQPMNWNNLGDVGRSISPMSMPGGIGGGVVLSSSDPQMIMWASKDGSREVYASVKASQNNQSSRLTNNIVEFGQALVGFKNSLGIDQKSIANFNKNNQFVRAAQGRNTNQKTNAPVTAGAGEYQTMDHFAKIAQEQRKKYAFTAHVDVTMEDASGNRVVLSTDGNISGFVKGVKAQWEPELTESQIARMENGEGTRVASELLASFAKQVKTAGWKPYTETDVKENELEPHRNGTKIETREESLEKMRSNNKGEKTMQEALGGDYYSNRRDADDDVKENMLDESAGLYGRAVNESFNEVKDRLLEDARRGHPENTLEEQLSECRENHGTAEVEVVMTMVKEAMAKAVVASRVLPEEIVSVAETLASRNDLEELVALASLGMNTRKAYANRRAFHKISAVLMAPDAALLHSLGEIVSREITASDVSEAIRVAASMKDVATTAVANMVEAMRDGEMVEAAPVNIKVSREERLKTALASSGHESFNKEHLKAVISAMVMASEETQATPEEVVDSLKGLNLASKINEARTASATDGRLTARARKQFWGNERFASKSTVSDATVGWIADYATNFDYSTQAVAQAVEKLTNDPRVATHLITKAIDAKLQGERMAGVTVTEEKSEIIRFVCRAEDLGGIDPKDEAFEDTFRQKAIEILTAQGFTVDPGTFSFTDLSVTENGDITASVQTRVTKTFKADAELPAQPLENMDTMSVAPEVIEPTVVMSEAAREARLARRQQILSKIAQAAPGMMPPAQEMGTPGMDASGMGMAGAEGLGVAALSVPTAAGDNPVEEPADTDAMPEPGNPKPIGTICPICGSDDVDLANSEGECNSCGTRYKVMQSIEIISIGGGEPVNNDSPEAEMDGMASPDTMGLGEDTGLGAATAPAPMGSPDMNNPGGMPPAQGMGAMASAGAALYRIAATVDSDVYLKTTMPNFSRTAEKQLPIGMVCPKCGSREAQKVKNSTFCYDCGNYAISSVKPNDSDPTKIDVSITWLA